MPSCMQARVHLLRLALWFLLQAEILQMEPPELYVRQVCCCHVLTRFQADLSSDSANQPAAMLFWGAVSQNPIPNAYTLAIAGRQPFIVIHTALLELLTPRELQVVASGELSKRALTLTCQYCRSTNPCHMLCPSDLHCSRLS